MLYIYLNVCIVVADINCASRSWVKCRDGGSAELDP